jgi:hypothetical protein
MSNSYEVLGAEQSHMPTVTGSMAPALVDPAAIAAAESAKARIQAAYVMAMHKPRSFMAARSRILEACKRPAFAGKVEYSKPVGKGNPPIKGPSIRFAELALREWQNVMVETQTIYEDDEKRRVLVRVLDLETNAAFSKEIQINKTVERQNATGREVIRERLNSYGKPVYIVRATEDELLTKEAATVSKAIRNEGLRLIPQDIIEEALDVAQKTRMGEIKDPSAFIKQLCDAFAALRVSPADLEEYLGHAVESCSKIEIDDLQTIFNAIKDGEAKWSDYGTSRDSGDKAKAGTEATADQLKERLGKAKDPTAAPEEVPGLLTPEGAA